MFWTEFQRLHECVPGLFVVRRYKPVVSKFVLNKGKIGRDLCCLENGVFLPDGIGIQLPSHEPVERVAGFKGDSLVDLVQNRAIPVDTEIIEQPECVETQCEGSVR